MFLVRKNVKLQNIQTLAVLLSCTLLSKMKAYLKIQVKGDYSHDRISFVDSTLHFTSPPVYKTRHEILDMVLPVNSSKVQLLFCFVLL